MASAAIVLTACGGGSDLQNFTAGQPICDPLTSESYQYGVQSVYHVLPPPSATPPPSTADYDGEFTFTETIQGIVSDGTKLAAHIDNNDGHQDTVVQIIELSPTLAYRNGGAGWTQEDLSKLALVKYLPTDLCSSLQPDVDTTKLGSGTAQTVNGIASHQYSFTALPTQFWARDPDWGPDSDPASYIPTIDGTISLADKGGFPTAFDITGTGTQPNGQQFTIRLTFQVAQFGQAQDVRAPV